jgi:hypothetical protein
MHHPPDRGGGRVNAALGQSEQGHPGFGLAAGLAGSPVRLLGLVELTPQAVELPQLVEGSAEGVPAREHIAGALGGVEGVGPGALELQDLAAVHQAVAAEGDETRLGVAPAGEGCGPLPRPAQVEQPLAGVDHLAVGDASDDRVDLLGCHRDHHLVQQGDPLAGLPRHHPRQAQGQACEREHVRIAEPLGDLGRLLEARHCR